MSYQRKNNYLTPAPKLTVSACWPEVPGPPLDTFRVIHVFKTAKVEVVIRFSAKRTWTYTVGEMEELGQTFQRFSYHCGLVRDGLVFRENFEEIVDKKSAFDLRWTCTANIDAVCRAKLYPLQCSILTWRVMPDDCFLSDEAYRLVLKSEKHEPVLRSIRASRVSGNPHDEAAFCTDYKRIFGEDTLYSLGLC